MTAGTFIDQPPDSYFDQMKQAPLLPLKDGENEKQIS